MPDGFHSDSSRIPLGFRDLIKQVSKQVASQATTTTTNGSEDHHPTVRTTREPQDDAKNLTVSRPE